MTWWTGTLESDFLIAVILSVLAGFFIGLEREHRGKPAGIATQCLVIGGAMTFAFISPIADPGSPARIAAQIVSGVGFLGAGIILKSESGTVANLTTAASIWMSAAIGMLIGLHMYFFAIVGTIYAISVQFIPHFSSFKKAYK